MLLDASSGGNIKPAQVLTALCQRYGEVLGENAVFVIREDTYTKSVDASGEERFVSLGEIGEEIGKEREDRL